MPLLSKWEEYLNQYPDGDMTGFARWILAGPGGTAASDAAGTRGIAEAAPDAAGTRGIAEAASDAAGTQTVAGVRAGAGAAPGAGAATTAGTCDAAPETDTAAQSLLLITRLHRILQFRCKPIVKYLGFTKPQEFSVLVQTAIMNNPNKKQLCQEMLIEGSTGVEITKRLAAKGFLKEKPDANDRRSALLSLTEKGKQTLLQGYTKLTPIHGEFLATLTGEEKKQLVSMLTRLNEYHTRQLPPLS